MRRIEPLAASLAALCAAGLAHAAERSYPLDCLPDRVAEWHAVAANPLVLTGAAFLPGIVLGPPGDSLPHQGSLSVASFGYGGSAVVAFDDVVIEDRPGPDFIVFENPFFRLPVPDSPDDSFLIFGEPGIVEVSADGEEWLAFDYDEQALAASAGKDVDPETYVALAGLAGLTPTFTGNWTVPDDPGAFDPTGPGGVSGAGGDAFDLASVGLAQARFVRLRDAETHNGFPGPSEGFDLDAVIALHARPSVPLSPDADGDRLSDAEELALYGTAPLLPDSDGDGLDDGREVAACRDPDGPSVDPWLHAEPRLWLRNGDCTELRWSFMGTGQLYDVVRGELDALAAAPGAVELGRLACLADDHFNVRWSCDPEVSAGGYFYLVRVEGSSDFGRSSALAPRTGSGDCP